MGRQGGRGFSNPEGGGRLWGGLFHRPPVPKVPGTRNWPFSSDNWLGRHTPVQPPPWGAHCGQAPNITRHPLPPRVGEQKLGGERMVGCVVRQSTFVRCPASWSPSPPPHPHTPQVLPVGPAGPAGDRRDRRGAAADRRARPRLLHPHRRTQRGSGHGLGTTGSQAFSQQFGCQVQYGGGGGVSSHTPLGRTGADLFPPPPMGFLTN